MSILSLYFFKNDTEPIFSPSAPYLTIKAVMKKTHLLFKKLILKYSTKHEIRLIFSNFSFSSETSEFRDLPEGPVVMKPELATEVMNDFVVCSPSSSSIAFISDKYEIQAFPKFNDKIEHGH